MLDESVRRLERRWRATGSDMDRLAYLRALERAARATLTDVKIREVLERRSRLVEAEAAREERRAEISQLGEGWKQDETTSLGPGGLVDLERTLVRLRGNRRRVWVVIGSQGSGFVKDEHGLSLAHVVAGTPRSRHAGYIARSMGPTPVWLVVSNAGSTGVDNRRIDSRRINVGSILEISDTKSGRIYWRHPSYDPKFWVWEKASWSLLEPWSKHALERMVYHAQELGVRAGDLSANLELPIHWGRRSLRSLLDAAVSERGEDWTRQAIEDAARRRLGNPGSEHGVTLEDPENYLSHGFYMVNDATARRLAGEARSRITAGEKLPHLRDRGDRTMLPSAGFELKVEHEGRSYWLARTPHRGRMVWSVREVETRRVPLAFNRRLRTLRLVVRPDPDEPRFTSFFWEDFTGEPWQLLGPAAGGTPLGVLTPEKIAARVARMVAIGAENGYRVKVVTELRNSLEGGVQ